MSALGLLRRCRRVTLLTVGVLVASSALFADSRTLIGGRVLAPDGSLQKGLAVVIENGRIARVVPDSTMGLPNPHRLDPDAVVSPGLIDLPSSLGVDGQDRTGVSTIDPAADIRDAIDPFDPRLGRALEAGVTAAMVAPAPRNVVAGTTATVRTHRRGETLETLTERGALLFAVGSSVLRRDEEPSSKNSAMRRLEQCVAEAQQVGVADGNRVREWIDRKRSALLVCESEADLRSALPILGAVGSLPHLVVAFENKDEAATRELARGLSAANVVIVVGPFDLRTPSRQLRAPRLIDRENGRLAFAGGMPSESRTSARLSAALAVRHGLSPAAARRALTIHAAEVAGVADRLGRIEAGYAADLVVFDGDPLRLDRSVREVYVAGELVHRHSTPPTSLPSIGASERGAP